MKRPYQLIEQTRGPWDNNHRFNLLKMEPYARGTWRVLYYKDYPDQPWEKVEHKKLMKLNTNSGKGLLFTEVRASKFLTEEEFFAELL